MDHSGPNPRAPDIATPDEVLETFTQLMRSEKTSEQLKAAEQLAKYHSLFAPKEEVKVTSEVIDAIEQAVQRIQEEVSALDDPGEGPA